MGNRLSISCYRIVLLKTKVNKTGTKWTQDILHESEGVFAGPMLNEDLSKSVSPIKYERLSDGAHSWSMQRMTRENVDVFWEMGLEGLFLRGLDRCLASNNCIHFRSLK